MGLPLKSITIANTMPEFIGCVSDIVSYLNTDVGGAANAINYLSNVAATFVEARTAGATGDGITDDTTALQAALNSAVDKTFILSPGTYLVSNSLVVPSNTIIAGPGIFKAAAALGAAPVLRLNGVTDVVLSGFEIDGNKSAYANTTEQRHGIQVDGGSARITLTDLYLHDCKGDGLYVGAGDGLTYVDTLEAFRVRSANNYRQGMSLTAAKRATFRDCWFANTSGTAPQAGVDLEPNGANAVMQDITFDGGGAYGNAGAGLQVQWPTTSNVQHGVVIRNFTVHNNTGSGISINQGRSVQVSGCSIHDNGDRGVVITDNCRGIEILSNYISLNGMQGIYVLAQFNTKFMTGLSIRGNHVFDNSTITPNGVDAIRIDWASGNACSGAIVTDNYCSNRDTSNQRYPFTSAGGTHFTDLVLTDNYLKGTASSISTGVLGDDSTTRIVRGNVGLADNKSSDVPTGTIVSTLRTTPDTGFLFLDGSTVLQTTYSSLFALGGAYVVSSNATHFTLPDMRQRFLLGKAASGTGSTLGSTGGAIDHVHTGPSHTHTIAAHTHTMAHTHAVPRDGWGFADATPPVSGRLNAGGSGAGSETTEPQATANNTTGASSAANTGATSLTTDAGGTANTGTANPPYIVVNYQVKT